MKQRLSYVWALALVTGGLVVSACGDDSSSGADDNGGSGGDPGSSAGTKAGGTTSGGSANKGGTGGKASGGTAGTATVGGAPDGGIGGVNVGGAGNSAGAAGSDAGAGGAGGAGEPALVYACGSDNQFQKTCSAWVAADCEVPTVCSDCVDGLTMDREGFQTDPPCDTCNAKYDAFYQCQVDAFESGMLDFGVVCTEGYPDATDNCYPLLDDAIACEGYVGTPNDCPATWPPQ